MDVDLAVVLDEAELPKLIHKEIDVGTFNYPVLMAAESGVARRWTRRPNVVESPSGWQTMARSTFAFSGLD